MSKETKNALISLSVILVFALLIGGMFLSIGVTVTNKPLMEVIYGKP